MQNIDLWLFRNLWIMIEMIGPMIPFTRALNKKVMATFIVNQINSIYSWIIGDYLMGLSIPVNED